MNDQTECIDCGRYFEARAAWQVRCYRCYILYKRKRDEAREATIPQEIHHIIPDPDGAWFREHLKKLIMLCHPDKHGGSEESHVVTTYLVARWRNR